MDGASTKLLQNALPHLMRFCRLQASNALTSWLVKAWRCYERWRRRLQQRWPMLQFALEQIGSCPWTGRSSSSLGRVSRPWCLNLNGVVSQPGAQCKSLPL